MKKTILATLIVVALLVIPISVALANTVTVTLLNGITGTGTYVLNAQAAKTSTNAQYYYQKAHGKGYGTSGNNGPYCVDEEIAYGYWLTVAQTPLISSSNSGGTVDRHYWSWSTGQSTTKYTSHDGNNANQSFFNQLDCSAVP
ncbi:MAG: hypothetical protein Fur0022_45770 [Anaerolineales bacterium]